MTVIHINYAGSVYTLEANEDSSRVVEQIKSAVGRGELIVFDHRHGRAAIAVSPGVPLTIAWEEEADGLGVF